MNGRRAVIGLCMLCALFVSAIAAQGASAATKGTTAFTCKELTVVGGVGFTKGHCRRADKTETAAKFVHVGIGAGVKTELSGTNAKTNSETNAAEPTFLAGTIGGIPVELKATTVSGTGEMVNSETSGEMIASGTGIITYTGATVTKPAGQGCKVKEEKVVTKKLKATTAGQPEPEEEANANMFLKFEPNEGTTFAEITIEGCETKTLNETFKVTGTVKGRPDGATTVFTTEDTKTQATLKLAGQTATLAGKITLSGKATADTAFTPLSVTTVGTK